MYIPIIPLAPHTTIINKTIVYSDTVLPLKDKGNDLKICSINDVSEDSLEKCLRKVFESNPDITFNTIQYSKKDRRVYFYTDKTISLKAWEDSKTTKLNPLSDSEKIIEEVSKLYAQEKNQDPECISLYDISYLIRRFSDSYNCIVEKYQMYFQNILENDFYGFIHIFHFDYDKKQLVVGFNYIKNEYYTIVFAKHNDDLFVVESETMHSQEILSLLGKGLSELFDELEKFSDFESQDIYNLKSLNSNFLVSINNYGVNIYSPSQSKKAIEDFKLSSPSYADHYIYKCNSNLVLSALDGKEDEIFKRIFVKIDDCPEWSKRDLYQMRQKQLAEEKRKEEKQRNKEMKKEKRLKFISKVFPWVNKSNNK